MNGKTLIHQSNRPPDYTTAAVKRMPQIGVLVLVQAAALLISAGRLDWLAGWTYIGVYVGFIVLNSLLILPHNNTGIRMVPVDSPGAPALGSPGYSRVLTGP